MRGLLRSIRSVDGLTTVGFVLGAGLESTFESWSHPQRLVLALPEALLLLPLSIRRRRPLLAVSIPSVGFAVTSLAQTHLSQTIAPPPNAVVPILALVFVIYSLAVHGTTRELLLGLPQPLLVVTVIDLVSETGHALQSALPFFALFTAGAPLLAGILVRSRNRLLARLQEQQRAIQAENVTQTAIARSRERLDVAARLQATLVRGVELLTTTVEAAQRGGDDDRLKAITRIEGQARELLTRTRTVIVGLAELDVESGVDRGQSIATEEAAAVPRSQTEPPHRLTGIDPAPWAALLAATFCVGLLSEARVYPAGFTPALGVLVSCLAVAAPLALIWYRPLLQTAIVWASATLVAREVVPISSVLAIFALTMAPAFAVSLHEPRRRAVLGLGICLLGAGATLGPGSLPFVVLSWLAGRAVKDRSLLVHSLHQNNVLLAQQQAAIVESAVIAERAEAAREVHDAVGHTLTVIALQAGAARRIWSSERGRAEEAVATLARVARNGLDDLRLVEPISARPGLDAITELVENARRAGLVTRLRVDDEAVALSADAQFAVYRVVQEALTNVLKHAPGACADVRVGRASGGFELRVANTTVPLQSSFAAAPGGRGLQGMRRRVEACGGRLNWARRDGEFMVRAVFPVIS